MKTARIIFEDDKILVVDKKSGFVVNRSETVSGFTVQDDLSVYLGLNDGDLGVGERAGIVHRLDKETSGLLVVAKDKKSFLFLQNLFKERKVEKKYLALVHGLVKEKSGFMDFPIKRIGKFGKFGIGKDGRSSFAHRSKATKGKEARTDFKVSKIYKISDNNFEKITAEKRFTKTRIKYLINHAREYSLLEVFPKTGRTHQIRVHLKSVGHPVVCDSLYTPNKLYQFDRIWCPRLFLHASELSFIHPKTKKMLEIDAKFPQDLNRAFDRLKIIKNERQN
jgi:23S rRNA pseudouridine1911/1915/1917 synthase